MVVVLLAYMKVMFPVAHLAVRLVAMMVLKLVDLVDLSAALLEVCLDCTMVDLLASLKDTLMAVCLAARLVAMMVLKSVELVD